MGNTLRCRPQQTVVQHTTITRALFHSIILMTTLDADYKVIMFDVGVNGLSRLAAVKGCLPTRQCHLH